MKTMNEEEMQELKKYFEKHIYKNKEFYQDFLFKTLLIPYIPEDMKNNVEKKEE